MKIPRGTLQKNKFHYQFSLTNTRPYTRFIFHVTLPVSLPVPAQRHVSRTRTFPASPLHVTRCRTSTTDGKGVASRRRDALPVHPSDIPTPRLEHMRGFGLSTLDHMPNASYCVIRVCCYSRPKATRATGF